MLVFLFVVAVFVVVAIGALAFRNRTERGIESGISSFRRELDALAPRGDPKAHAVPRREPEEPEADDGAREVEDDADDEDDDYRTVQIGNQPPPRRLSGGRSTIAGRTPSPAPEPDSSDSAGTNADERSDSDEATGSDADPDDDDVDESDVERADGS